MRKRVFIHIGFGKTGTSSIQSMLRGHEKLLRQHGTLYPLTGRVGNSHLGLSVLPHKRDKLGEREAQLTALRTEFIESGCHTLIVSAESLCFSVPELAALFRRALDDFSVQVMMYVRKQSELVASTYLQWVKTGWDYQENIEDFFHKHRGSFDFGDRIAPWARAFGDKSIAVHVYDRRLIPDVCRQFLDCVGYRGKLINLPSSELNASLLPEFVPLVRQIDACGLQDDQRVALVNELLALSRDFKGCSEKERLVSPELAESITRTFAASNRRIARQYLDTHSSQYLLEPGDSEG